MKNLNFEQMEKLSAGTEMVSGQLGIELTEDPLTRNQKCLALGGVLVAGIAFGAVGQGWGFGLAGAAVIAGILNC